MPQILFVHASAHVSNVHPENQGTYARKMARLLKDRLKGRGIRVLDRDVAARPPCMVDPFFIAAANTAEDERTPEQHNRLRESDELVAEVLKSDVIVVSCPIYRFGVPTPLRAWADNLVRPGITLTRGDKTSAGNLTYGLLHNKLFVMLETTAAGSSSNSTEPQLSPAEQSVTRVLSHLGVRNIERVIVRGIDADRPEHFERNWMLCQNSLESVAERVKSRWRDS